MIGARGAVHHGVAAPFARPKLCSPP
jgi:hypothetical protein